MPRRVSAALEEVGQWAAEATQKHETEVAEVDQEVENLQQAVANLQQQLEALARFKEELLQRTGSHAQEETQRTYDAVFSVLGQQALALTQRSAVASVAAEARQSALAEQMRSDPDISALLLEYEQFKTSVEPTLEVLPDSYRSVIIAHHESVARRLREHMSAGSGLVELEAETLELDVVYAIDAPEGQAELLLVVLPVSEAVQTEWFERSEDLEVHLAARLVQGLYKACQSLHIGGIQAMYGGHQGLLAVELELPEGVAPQPLAEAVEAALAEVTRGAEPGAAKVSVHTAPMKVDHLLPPEEVEVEVEEVSNDG